MKNYHEDIVNSVEDLTDATDWAEEYIALLYKELGELPILHVSKASGCAPNTVKNILRGKQAVTNLANLLKLTYCAGYLVALEKIDTDEEQL